MFFMLLTLYMVSSSVAESPHAQLQQSGPIGDALCHLCLDIVGQIDDVIKSNGNRVTKSP